MFLTQEHNAVLPARLEPATPLSQVKPSTTEPLGIKGHTESSQSILFIHYKASIYTDVNLNASLIITDFSAMIYKNEQSRTASLCRGWPILGNDFNLICRRRVIPMTSYRLNVHMTALCIDHL